VQSESWNQVSEDEMIQSLEIRLKEGTRHQALVPRNLTAATTGDIQNKFKANHKINNMQSYQHQVRRRNLAKESKEKEKYVPPLYKYLDKTVFIQIKNGGGKVSGTFEGFDVFQNLILANAVNESQVGVKEEMIGRVVRFVPESFELVSFDSLV
jgi:small nuclear ribonucleoprotein (snRNP)-like protein